MKIKPNYSKQHICHFCKKNIADFECGTSTHLHCLYRSGFMSYKFKIATVEVPRCKKCKIKHTISYLPGAIVALIIVWVMIELIVSCWMNDHSIDSIDGICGTIVMLISTAFLAWCSFILSHLIFAFIVRVKPNKWPEFIDNYEPIRKLREIGFNRLEKHTDYPQTTPFTEESFSDRLNSIVEKDNCIVYDGNFVYGD